LKRLVGAHLLDISRLLGVDALVVRANFFTFGGARSLRKQRTASTLHILVGSVEGQEVVGRQGHIYRRDSKLSAAHEDPTSSL
jgi:hypothetical protein